MIRCDGWRHWGLELHVKNKFKKRHANNIQLRTKSMQEIRGATGSNEETDVPTK